jgi:hypothetical protein
MTKGWTRESARHALAAKGVKTKIKLKNPPAEKRRYLVVVKDPDEEYYRDIGSTDTPSEAVRLRMEAELCSSKKYDDVQVVAEGEYEVFSSRKEFEINEDVTADGYGLGVVIEGTRNSKNEEWSYHIKWRNGFDSWLLGSKLKGVVEAGRGTPTYEETKSGKYRRQHKWYIKTEDGKIKYY